MKRFFLTCLVACLTVAGAWAQRNVDRLDRGLLAMKVTGGVYVTWRVLGEEYYDVAYNVYRDGVKVNDEPLTVSNFLDTGATAANMYSVAPVVRGEEREACAEVKPWATSYKEIALAHEGILSTLVPNDATCADVDGDGELEIIMKFDNLTEAEQSYPKAGPTVNGVVTGEYSIFECFKLDGTRLWWINCGPNMGDFQNNEQNIMAYDWDGDGKAECVMRAADGTVIHMANGQTYTVGNASVNVRAATGGGTNWFVITQGEYLLYLNGETGEPYQCITYPLPLLESGETDVNRAWGDGYGHRASKHFFGAPYLDGQNPSIFLARGIYTRHKMIAYDVDPGSHSLIQRWRWNCNTNGPWKGQGFHNYGIADVDWDGRDEIVFGSMVIDDNGNGLSTTGLGHGDAQHCGDFNPYMHGQEIYTCLEDNPGNNYRDATTSKIYHRFQSDRDDGRAMAGNFTDDFPGALGCSAHEGAISLVTNGSVSGLDATGVNTNFRIYWDGDLLSETFNYLNGKNTEGCVAKYGSWSPIYTMAGSLTNNDTKGTPCFQGDILGDWREEVIMRTANNRIRIYSTPTPTQYRNYTLWHDHQYRNAMQWQMCGYNQPPHVSYFLGELEGITVAPPPLINTDRIVMSGGAGIGSGMEGQHVLVYQPEGDFTATIYDGADPTVLTFNVPTWVQGTAGSESTNASPRINYATYTCTVSGGGMTGSGRLVKQGDGILTLPKADFTHTGETNIWAGVLNFDGTLTSSPLWLNRFAELNSDGGQFMSVKADYASIIRPGGADQVGTIKIGRLTMGFGSRIVFDLNSEGIAADKVELTDGKLTIERKTGNAWENGGPQYLSPVVELVGHTLQGAADMAPGKYILMDGVKEVDGDVNDLVVEGLETTKKVLYLEGEQLILEVKGLRDTADLVWTGSSNIWDYADTPNFKNSGDQQGEEITFVAGDNVLFNDEAANKTVNVEGSVIPATFTVNTASTYTFNGTGTIDGEASFIKEGTGTVVMNGENTYTGGNTLKGGTTRVSMLSNQYTEAGNLGGITTNANKFTMENGAVLQTTKAVEMGSPMRMIGDEGGVINNSQDFIMDKAFSGTLLTKKGSGSLKINAANSLSKIILQAGAIDLNSGNPATTVELQGGSLWDNTQSTGFAIYVPKGKSGTFNLTYTYYTAYNNKLTGEGTITFNPRNTVSRVRITGDWSQFEGTVNHSNKDIWLPLDNSTGIPKGTLNIEAGCGVTNVCKTFTIGQLTGAGSLNHAISNFQNQNSVSGNNTWNVGNSDGKDFTFDGIITDAGGTNKSIFNKIGTCKMNVKGKWTHTGPTNINAGELHFNNTALLGKGALTVAKDATLSGYTDANVDLTNTAYTINGTLQVGAVTTSTTGQINFGNKNVTFNAGSTLRLGIRRAATASATGGTSIQNISKLTMNGTISIFFSGEPTLEAGDEVILWKADNFTGNPTLESIVVSAEKGLVWDTSRLQEGVLVVAYDPATAIRSIRGNQTTDAVYTLDGRLAGIDPSDLKPGIYIRGGKKFVVK